MEFDTIVLGAGIVGVSTAVHLRERGQSVALVDRIAPGHGTSFGNAGLIQREGVYPYAFPREWKTLLTYARNRAPDVRYHGNMLLKLSPFLYQYWHHSRADRHAAIARPYSTLIEHCVAEHRRLVQAANAYALLRTGGWIKTFRTQRLLDVEMEVAEHWKQDYGVAFDALNATQLQSAEPSLTSALVGGMRFTDADSVSDPSALVSAYARYFEKLGGHVLKGDAMSLTPGWRIKAEKGEIAARSVVVALGPWSENVTRRLGYDLPLAVKRGYHMHYATENGARLNQPVLDAEMGFMLTPMTRGIRLTTGVELADRDSRATPVQLDSVEPSAKQIFPLGKRLDDVPWMGSRPCTPDMLPIIGPAPRHHGLWFGFGHAHHGLTLGPITGRILAEMITGEEPIVDPYPFRAERF